LHPVNAVVYKPWPLVSTGRGKTAGIITQRGTAHPSKTWRASPTSRQRKREMQDAPCISL
ncbi:MAG: hypothetical protein V2J65_15535, partial [Desulfobacteraceae bacterium]|nr:hypothetical protein [Desulfobacteraceae bacterium]